MDKKILQKLEFHKVKDMLEKRCSSQMGKEKVWDIEPIYNLQEIQIAQEETSEAKDILRLFPVFTLGGIRDIRVPLKKAEVGGIVEPQGFLYINDTLDAVTKIKDFFNDEGDKYPLLLGYMSSLHALPDLERQIKKVITRDAEVSDNASSELSKIRKQLRGLQGKVKERLESIIRSPEMQKYLQDPIITIRNERYVVPVKQEYRQQVPGLIHDQSGSGATIFVEPMVVVELNNETQRLEAMEKAEVTRILRQLTLYISEHLDELKETQETLAILDFIFAKARLSHDLDCGQPRMNERGYLSIIRGRHPLISGKVVPITINLGDNFDTLVITGPNTGGKTVTLKTVGLFTVMAQAGMHVPAEIGTELSIFKDVCVDIGDEQSIEQSLSTFSAHMTNIINILDKVDGQSLVLLDELGAGTDPTEGAALAMAILEHLIKVGAKTIATTHYSELKSYAYNQERVENASVEFDVETLRPTYRLLIGVPGKSNAFEISKRLGLKDEVVLKARDYLSQEELKVADLIENLETNQMLSEKDRKEAADLKKLAQEKLIDLERKQKQERERSRKIIEKAQKEALEIVTKARRESETILKEVKDINKRFKHDNQEELRQLRNKLREKESDLFDVVYKEDEAKEIDPKKLKEGDTVIIKRLNQKAQVLQRANAEGQVFVQAGIMKLYVKLNEIKMAEETKKEDKREKSGVGAIVSNKAKDIKNEIDLRGMTVDDALFETEKYLDDAYLAGIPKVYIIHGKGTGALRSAISDMVKKHRFVKGAMLGGYHEGGHGVTVVEFKK